jgi:hypothetical protein
LAAACARFGAAFCGVMRSNAELGALRCTAARISIADGVCDLSAATLVRSQRLQLLACSALHMHVLRKLFFCEDRRTRTSALQKLIARACSASLVVSWLQRDVLNHLAAEKLRR